MALITLIITPLSVVLLLMLSSSAVSLQIHVPSSPSSHDQGHHHPQLNDTPLSRKLKLKEAYIVQYTDQKAAAVSGRRGVDKKGGAMSRVKRGTWQEWKEVGGADSSEFFTMDYSHVRRRRPVHNKSLPVGP